MAKKPKLRLKVENCQMCPFVELSPKRDNAHYEYPMMPLNTKPSKKDPPYREVPIVFEFTGSVQGKGEAFMDGLRFANERHSDCPMPFGTFEVG